MTKPVHALCDQCNYITDVVFHKAKHPNGIEETYFTCERCFYRYTSFVTDSWVRKQHKKKDKLTTATKRLELQEEINSRMSRLKYNLINFGRADL